MYDAAKETLRPLKKQVDLEGDSVDEKSKKEMIKLLDEIKKVKEDSLVTVHANKQKNEAGSRHYIHAEDVSDALLFLFNFCSE